MARREARPAGAACPFGRRHAGTTPGLGERARRLATGTWPPGSLTTMGKVELSEQEWRDRLSPEEYHVLREAGTEAPFTGEYTDTETKGVYKCRACGAELFRSNAKFHSGCGWPSFYQPTEGDAVILIEDRSLGRVRTEVRCASCNSHLGHVFEGEGYDVPTDQRWCINSVSLALDEE
jgi:peptide-methionine (R)-S-oxide reductase